MNQDTLQNKLSMKIFWEVDSLKIVSKIPR